MPPLVVEPVTDEAAFSGLAPEWDALFAATPAASGFQSFAWAAACRAHAPAPGRRLFTLVVRDGTETVAIVPSELGVHGELCFIGDAVSNYLGPVFRPGRLPEAMRALGGFLDGERIALLDLRAIPESSPFLAAWSALHLPGWAEPGVVRTARCPYVDLSAGWKGILARRKSSSRTLLARKQKSLARLGRVELVETGRPGDVRAALPAMFRLFAGRWAGRHESGGFADRLRSFHEHAAPALAAAGNVRLSLLTLDGHVVAFSYGVRNARGTSSYVLAHDDALGTHSPGLVLLLRLLEAACERGDTEYDFSLGEETYKDQWATGMRNVVRLLQWRRRPAPMLEGALRALGSYAWNAARSVRAIRDLRRDGPRRWLLGAPPVEARPDHPGIAAGTAEVWTVYRTLPMAPAAVPARRTWPYADMRRYLSPRLLELAIERSYRNDPLIALYDGEPLLGLVWRASRDRRALVTGGFEIGASEPVYYHPIPAPGRTCEDLVRALAAEERGGFVVVTPHADLPALLARPVGRFTCDLRFKPTHRRGPAADAHVSSGADHALDVRVG